MSCLQASLFARLEALFTDPAVCRDSVGKPRAIVRMTRRLPLTPHCVGCPSPLRIDRGDGDLLLGVEADEAECVLGAQAADRTRTICDIQQLSLWIKDKRRGLEDVPLLFVPTA